jgi:MYXO-CTERM domain-containing protein
MRAANWYTAIVVGSLLLASAPAWAGEVKVGFEPLDTDDSGKLTKEAADQAVTTLEAQPGNESWMVNLWAKIDNGADGPIYIEFGRVRDGRRLIAAREEIADYAGDKYLSASVEIFRSDGFRPEEVIQVAFVQNIGGKDAIKASTDVTLAASSAPEPKAEAPDEPPPEDDLDGPDEDDAAPAAAPPSPDGPPPVESGDKKGCTIAGPTPAPAWMLLVALLALPRRRRGG